MKSVLEKRLAVIQNDQNDETTEEQFSGGVHLVDNVEGNRLQIFFPEIPSEEIRRELKRYGFHWAPTAGAWQRHRSTRATYLAKLILTTPHAMTPSILDEPIRGAAQQRRKLRSHALPARTWFHICRDACEWQKTYFAPAVKQQLFPRGVIRLYDKGLEPRQGSNHEIHPVSTRRDQPAFCSPRGGR